MKFIKPFPTILIFLLLFSNLYASSKRIINGDIVASDNEKYESIVALLDTYDSQFCGATLISSKWVLTAAHCLENLEAYDVKVLLNTYNLNNLRDAVSVKRVILHPLYDGYKLINDIGLIELSSEVTAVSPIPIYLEETLSDGQDAWIAGWGNISIFRERFPVTLMDALVPIIDIDECNGVNSYDGDLTENQICAGYMSGLKDSCQGDSGGPLIVENNGAFELAGIVSYGGSDTQNCAAPNFPGIYTKVQSFSSWIDSYINDNATSNSDNVKTSLTQTDITNLNLNKWYLSGTTSAITDLSIFNDVQIIFIYQDEKFKAYSPMVEIREILQNEGYEIVTSIPANSGIWIKK